MHALISRVLNATAAIAVLAGFAPQAYATIPTGGSPSPMFGVQKFTQPMPRFDVLPRNPVATLNPPPAEQSNQTQQACDPALGGGFGPIEGRPPGSLWAHQGFANFPPQVAVEISTEGAKANISYNPGVPPQLNSGIDPTVPFPAKFHPGLPTQDPLKVWTFNGTIPSCPTWPPRSPPRRSRPKTPSMSTSSTTAAAAAARSAPGPLAPAAPTRASTASPCEIGCPYGSPQRSKLC